MNRRIDRRGFLCLGIAAGAGIAGIAAGRRARALSLEPMTEGVKRSYLSACEAPNLHQQLIAEIDAKLGGGGLTREQIVAIKTSNRCPLCGCPLVEAEALLPGAAATKN
ncbi:MAG: hypothetical protein ACT4N4_00310 [Rhodospirillales bacterium]